MQEYQVTVNYKGDVEWRQNGKLHRLDGPALEYANGEKQWRQNGKLHREDGPALEYYHGRKEWWIDGKQITEYEFNSRNQVRELSIAELQTILGYKIKIVE